MTEDTAHDAISALDDLLERERGALLEGDLDAILRQMDAKAALIENLNETVPAASDALHGVQRKLARNQELLNSALQGIRSVSTRLNALTRIRRTLETYDETGRKTTIEGLGERAVEKRA